MLGGGTIRTSFNVISEFSLEEFVKSIISNWKYGQYHCGTSQQYFVFPVCAIYFIISNACAFRKEENKKKIMLKPYNIAFTWFLLNGLLTSIASDMTIMQYVYQFFPVLRALPFQRFIFYNPLAIYLCVMFITVDALNQKRYVLAHELIWLSLLTVIFGTSGKTAMYNDIGRNIKYILAGETIGYPKLTWHEIISEDLFKIIKEDIDYQGEWCIAYGFLPSILNYNGIYTLDGYDSGYSSEYKDKFAKLISPYLQIGENYVEYFQNVGTRAYIFSDDIGYMPEDYIEIDEAPIYIDPEIFRNMGGKYVFSVTEISNSNELHLGLCGIYVCDDSPYKMYVYCV